VNLEPAQPLDPASGDWSAKNLVFLLLLTVFAFLVMGYHPGLEDDAFYLAAIKRDLNPYLFPHDSAFFAVQFQATIFDKLIAFFVRFTNLPVAWAALLWQFGAIFFLLHGCWRIARRCFAQTPAQWAAVAMIAVLLTLPVTGVGINIADQHLHPRTLATAAILAAIVAVLDRRIWFATVLLAFAFSIHAIMACFGISFCMFLWWNLRSPSKRAPSAMPIAAAFLVPLGWIFEPPSDAWRKAAATRSFYFLTRWEWYEWLGVFAPLVLLYTFHRFLQRPKETEKVTEADSSALQPFVKTLVYYGVFQTIVGLAIMLPPSLERLRPFEPMRYLHLLYIFFFLLAGGLLGRYVLGRRVYRWVLLFLPVSAGMFYAQRQMYPATVHIEFPGTAPSNAWLQAFAWIRQNTPTDSLFALDPHYTQLRGEDYHGFRALAERSALADYDKDGGMAARVPSLAPRWLKEVTALNGWQKFQDADFTRLKKDFGVNWIVLSTNDLIITNAAGFSGVIVNPMTVIQSDPVFTCPYVNQGILVCRLY
jgi:hypothetical protein